MARQYFGTDGVRGVVGETLTVELVERLGKAAALWCGRGRIFVGRDTRASGAELEEAFARGIASAGGSAVLAGVLPTPAVALLGLDLGAVISASHNPPEYNGVKFFDRDGRKLTDAAEEEIEALLDGPAPGGGEIDRVEVASDSYLEHVLERFGTDLTGLRIAVDCANGAYAGLAPQAFEQLGAEVTAIGNDAGRDEHQRRLRRDRPRSARRDRARRRPRPRHRLRRRRRPDARRGRARRAGRRRPDPRGPRARPRVEGVAVTTMTNLGFHRLMEERGIRVVVTDVGDRYVLEALRREGLLLGGEQSGHLIWLDGHVTGDGLVAGLLLCRALGGRAPLRGGRRHAALPAGRSGTCRAPAAARCPASCSTAVEDVNAELDGTGRVLVRPSGTEPVVRVLAEAETPEDAERLCARIAALVTQELG